MPKYKKIKFVIDGFTPLTFPIGRLAEYLRNFAALVGPTSDVHFKQVGEGSAALISLAPEEVVPDVRGRVSAARSGTGPVEANRAFAALRALLHEDKTTGRIKEDNRKILEFPAEQIPQFGPVVEEGMIEGVLIKLGGRDETVPVHLQDGERYYKCEANRTMAKNLAPFLFGDPIRVFGRGKWVRTEQGEWELEKFQISNYEKLSSDELQHVLDRMRQIPGSGWDAIEDPLDELDRIRKGNDKVQ